MAEQQNLSGISKQSGCLTRLLHYYLMNGLLRRGTATSKHGNNCSMWTCQRCLNACGCEEKRWNMCKLYTPYIRVLCPEPLPRIFTASQQRVKRPKRDEWQLTTSTIYISLRARMEHFLLCWSRQERCCHHTPQNFSELAGREAFHHL